MRGTFDEVLRDRARAAEKFRREMKKETSAEIKVVKGMIKHGRTDLDAYLESLQKKLEKLD